MRKLGPRVFHDCLLIPDIVDALLSYSSLRPAQELWCLFLQQGRDSGAVQIMFRLRESQNPEEE